MEAVAIICNKFDGKLTKRILISFSSNMQAKRVDFNEKEAVAIINEKLMTNRVHHFFIEIAGFDARSLDTPYLSPITPAIIPATGLFYHFQVAAFSWTYVSNNSFIGKF